MTKAPLRKKDLSLVQGLTFLRFGTTVALEESMKFKVNYEGFRTFLPEYFKETPKRANEVEYAVLVPWLHASAMLHVALRVILVSLVH